MAKKTKGKPRKSSSFSIDEHSIQSTLKGNRVLWGRMSLEDESKAQFTTRNDYAHAIDIRIPQGYHAQARKAWEMYDIDRLFRYLIDRTISYGANGFEWESHIDKEDLWKNINKSENSKLIIKSNKEKRVWDKWASSVNSDVANVIPGLDEINKWIFKHILINGMAPLEWEWGKLEVDGKMYEFPLRVNIHNSLAVSLHRKGNNFMGERAYVRMGENATASSNAVPNPGDKSWHEIDILGTKSGKKKRAIEGFVIKYNWSPGDNTITTAGKSNTVGRGLYPTPPFLGLYDILKLRAALVASDLAILDGVINYIVDWEIGDNTTIGENKDEMPNQPQPAKKDADGTVPEKSTIEMVKEMITQENRANVMQLFHPYYIKLNIKTPDTTSLVSAEKYVQSIVEMFLAFGIFLSPTDRRIDFTDINIANFEQMVDNIRLFHIRRFWEALCVEIVDRNKNLKSIPNMVFNSLNTQNDEFRGGLLALANIGKISSESLLQGFKKDKKVETTRIAREVLTGEKKLMDENVPVSYVQKAVNPAGGSSETKISPGKQEGRPVEKPASNVKKNKE